jgi:LL-diaminopimelate aminotransferase
MIQKMFAERIGGESFGKDTTIYKFAMIKKAKEEALRKNPHRKMIDMGVGEPDTAASDEIVEVLRNEAGKPENRFYSDNGIPEFNEAACRYMENVFGVSGLNSEKHVLHGIGSKPILAMLPTCFINSGDVTLATVPGYPVLSTWTRYMDGEVVNLPLTPENHFFPDLEQVSARVLERAKLLYINYPNNPTGQVATKEFYKKVVKFAKEHRILVVADSAYANLTYDGEQPLSFLSTEGAMDVGVELHSLSKAYNMTGWRMAFAVGNPLVIQAYGAVKDNSDSGQFRAIQQAGIYAMNHPQITEGIRRKYSRRFDKLVVALKEIGFQVEKPKGSFFLYAKAPKGTLEGRTFHSAQEVSRYIIEEASVSLVPWDDAGSFLRFSVTFEASSEAEENTIIQEMKQRFFALNLTF